MSELARLICKCTLEGPSRERRRHCDSHKQQHHPPYVNMRRHMPVHMCTDTLVHEFTLVWPRPPLARMHTQMHMQLYRLY